MKKVIRLTESDLIKLVSRIISEDESETEVEITSKSQDILNQYERLKKDYEEKHQNLVQLYDQVIEPVQTEVTKLKSELNDFERYYIPKISLLVGQNKYTGIKYLRASVRYYVEGGDRQKNTTIHIGRLSDYLGGINDPEVKKMAMLKAVEYLAKIRRS